MKKFFFGELSIQLPSDLDNLNYQRINYLFAKMKDEPYSLNRVSEILDEIEYNIGVNANILSKIFGIHNENQCICISYDNELENILLTFKSENLT